jgi:hypothetical protein
MIDRLFHRAALLPRETRDTYFHLFVVSWTIAPHLLHLPWWCGAMTVALLGWRLWLAGSGGALPSRWIISLILTLAAALTLWTEKTLLGKEAGITMLVVLMALKMLEMRARRDALVVFFLGFFLVLTHFLYSQNLATGLWLLVAVWGLLTALVLAHLPLGRPPLRRAGAVSARAALLGVPLMALLFVLFPRLGPLWGLPQDAQGRTGLSGSMRLGGVAKIAEDESIAMRVRFFGAPPPQDKLYFRGPVLSTFDGREWTRLVPTFAAAMRPRLDLQLRGEPLRYEMTVEPSRLPLLPLLEMTPDRPDAAPSLEGWLLTLRPDGQWQVDRPVVDRVRIEASAWLDHRHGPQQDVVGLRDLVDLPPGANPRTLQWAVDLRRSENLADADARTLAAAVLRHIARDGYTYTLEPPPYGQPTGPNQGRDAIDEFWIDQKLGFCEHFASAFVVVMRALDVPARIVTGYQGADPPTADGYLVVRQRNAHAWAEIWQAGTGWIRVDPTAAVAPDRVQRGRSLERPPGLVAGAIGSLNPQLAGQLRQAWEGVNNRWNQWVLNYSRGQQFELMRALGFETPTWQDLASALALLLCAGALAGAAWAWLDRRRQDPWQRLQRRVQTRLAALGVSVQAHHPPRERAARVRAALGPRGEGVAQALDALDHQRYGAAAAFEARRWWRAFASAARGVATTHS